MRFERLASHYRLVPDVVAHDRGEVCPITSVQRRQHVFTIVNRLVPWRWPACASPVRPCAVFNSQENDRGFLLTVMPRPHQATGAIRECNHKVQIVFVPSPENRDPDFVRSSLVIPTITLQFQSVRGLGKSTRCGLWYLLERSCDKTGAMSGQTRRTDVLRRVGRRTIHYAIAALAALCNS